MQGLIIMSTKSGHFCDLKELMDALDSDIANYSWMLSGYDCFSERAYEKIPPFEDFVWFDGKELARVLNGYQPYFIFCVATGYPKNIVLEEVLRHPLPFADGYTEFWKTEVTMQNPLSEMEIVLWDSSLFLVISKSREVIGKFKKTYPNSIDLAEYNRRS